MKSPRQITAQIAPLFFSLLAVFLFSETGDAAQPVPAPPERWEKDITAFETGEAASPTPKNAIVFVGSSSIRKWSSLATDFPHHQVINRGFGGSLLSDSVHFIDRLVLKHEPRFIVVYAGGNDINANKTPENVFASFKELVGKIRAKQPSTPIAYISIASNPKRWSQVEKVIEANRLIEAYTKANPGLIFINVFHQMLGPDGMPKPEIFSSDNLHMNEEGYKLWTEIIAPYLPSPDKP
jgi:lysophospholipase L1-like esterase